MLIKLVPFFRPIAELGDVGGKVHSVEGAGYTLDDIANETTVVDGVGQRLTLNIENSRGGGGQRRISLYCPFWIVNTTEHALRFKQEKSKSFVSGNVVSEHRDGSRPVDGSNRNYTSRHKTRSPKNLISGESAPGSKPLVTSTVFSGTPGALATSPGRCDLPATELAALVDQDMPLPKMAELAYMFNFTDDGIIGNQMLSVQLYDGTGQSKYRSDWSRGFSLESVGFSQIVG